MIRGFPNRETEPARVISLRIHRREKRTRGTETSQYPEERTSTETPVVVASEPGPGQCCREIKSNDLERSAIAGDSPVDVK